MFAKPYKLKSNNTLKNSEKKHLIQRIIDEFASATEEKAKLLVPIKSNSSCMKLVTHSGDIVDVYVVDGIPMVMEVGQGLVPTVCALWKVPDLVATLTIHTPVLTKIQGGAPLYLPGVVIPAAGAGFPMFARGAALAACTADNATAIAVGRAALSSGDLLLKTGGVCMDMIHWYGDLLCKDPKFSKIERPAQPPRPLIAQAHGDTADVLAGDMRQLHLHNPAPVREEWPRLQRASPPPPTLPPQQHTETQDDCLMEDSTSESSSPAEIPTDMDSLLQWSLLSFLKLHGKTIDLPLKTSLLYRNYLLPLCPPDRTIDVKKSTYKKMGKFLEAMQKEGLIEVREVEKGVDAVVAVNTAHPLVRGHAPPALVAPPPAHDDELEYVPPVVREMFSVTSAVLEIFAPLKKGSSVSASEVRSRLSEYVRARGLHGGGAGVALDAALARAMGAAEQETVKWEALMLGVQNKMTACTEMRFADGTTRLARARLEPVKMQVANRSGNKKVTLVSNLEQFGFSLAELSRLCQRGVAAACGVTRAPGARCDQLMLQGDQTYYVAKLLIEKFGLPKKYVEGADKALKKKKG